MIHPVRLLFITALLGSSLAQDGSPPDSPCPAVFKYSHSPSQGWHGVVSIVPPLTFSEVQLVLRLSVAYFRPDTVVGKIEVSGGAAEVQNIANRASQKQRQTIQYLVIFPPYNEFPQISSVKFNGNEFCGAAPTQTNARGVIDLKYSLKTGLAVAFSNGNEFSIDGGSSQHPQHTWQQQQQSQQSWQQPQEPQQTWQQQQKPQQTWQQTWQQKPQPTQQPTWQQQQQSTESPSWPPQQPQQTWTQQQPQPQQPQQTWTQQQSQPQQPQQTWTQQKPQPTIRPERPSVVQNRPATPDPDEAYLEILAGATEASTRPPRPRPTKRPATSTTLDEYDLAEEEDDIPVQYAVNSEDCGQPLAVNKLVVRGEETRRGEWPWMAAIYTIRDNKFKCAGSLISRKHVITAAHCVTDFVSKRAVSPSSVSVHLGRYNLSQNEPDKQVMEIQEIEVNPKFSKSRKQDYDIGVMILKNAAVINDFVKTVCLWDTSLDASLDSIVGKTGMAPGWGQDEYKQLGKELRLARMPVVSPADCLKSDADFFYAVSSDKTFCAGFTNGTTLCNGDSGGGLFFKWQKPGEHRKAWYVRGIVSLSKPNEINECGESNYVVFTDVPMVMTWLQKKLSPPPY